jgi:hypothetical protein
MNLELPALLLAAASLGCASAPLAPSAAPRPLVLGPPDGRAVVVVRIPTPWWAPRFLVTSRFIDSIPEYAALPALEHKAYTFADDGRFGGVYLWAGRAPAEAHFGPAWRERVRRQRGVEADVRILDVRASAAGPASPEGEALPRHGLRTDAAVTWVTTAEPVAAADREARLAALAGAHGTAPGLVRVSFVTEPEGGVGAVALWASRGAAERFWDGRLEAVTEALGHRPEVAWFSAPVLLEVGVDRASQGGAAR